MLCCQKSKHVVQLVESFSFDSNLYLVTKYASGGDLLQYCLAQDNSKQWMDEKRAKHIFAQLDLKGCEAIEDSLFNNPLY